MFQVAKRVVDELLAPTEGRDDKRSRVMRLQSRHQLFPQAFRFVQEYVRTRVRFNGVDERELGLEKYTRLLVERIRDGIYPDNTAGEPPLLPVLNRYKPYGSTSAVDFTTTRPVGETVKSHINLVVQHSNWEGEAAQLLDLCPAVACYARNDHLGLTIPYEYLGVDHSYEPDFLIRLTNNLTVVLEIKGFEVHEPEQTNQKHSAARKWVTAVNNLGDFGRWNFLVCRDLDQLVPALTDLSRGKPVGASPAVPRPCVLKRQ